MEYIRANDERKFMDILGPAKAGENHLKQASIRRMSMVFTNLTVAAQKSAITGSSGPNAKNVDEFRLLTEMVRHERMNFLQTVNKRQLFAVTQRD